MRVILKLFDTERLSDAERERFVTWPIAGRLTAVAFREIDDGKRLVSTILERKDAEQLGLDDDALFRQAMAAMKDEALAELDAMRVTDECILFVFRDEYNIAARALDLPALLRTLKLPPRAERAARIGEHGALFGVPSEKLIIVFFVDGGDLATGIVNLVENVHLNYDEDDDDALSPWIYWVNGSHVEECEYDFDEDGELDSLNLPNALNALLPDEEQ